MSGAAENTPVPSDAAPGLARRLASMLYEAILLFGAGLWATYEHALFMAVLLLALAANFNRQSSHHALVYEVMDMQRLLAMLINNQSREIESLKRAVNAEGEFDAP